jgi:ubiquinone/menaquinone biosynthesis C-methylase UbiE
MTEDGERRGFGTWYDDRQGEEGDLWHRTLIDPGLFARLGELPKGTRVLDLGCGNGYIARRLARRGARVVGVDASAELIERARARERAGPLGIVYHCADAAHIPMVADASVDVAVANMSLIDIEDAAGAIREVGRVLRGGGRLVASISHPCFDIDTRSAWIVESVPGSSTVFRKVTDYRRPHSDTYPWRLPDGSIVRTTGYHRPLAWYAQVLRESGFVIVALEEPSPSPEFGVGRIAREWVEEIPLHLVIEARREGTDERRARASHRTAKRAVVSRPPRASPRPRTASRRRT